MRTILLCLALLALTANQPIQSTYTPERVYDTRQKGFSDFEAMLADLARADVVMLGEQHDDPNTHRLEAAVLEGLKRRGVPVILSLEMFERDVQGRLDDYLAGRIAEDEFLRSSRPWPRYASDYRPLVEIAKANGWPVVASNVPRPSASAVAKTGLDALEKLPPDQRGFAARELQCPLDRYFQRFSDTMNEHPDPASEKLSAEERKARTERYYYAQCVKDESMAESIAAAASRHPDRRVVVHVNGAFHSDFGLGVAERTRRRMEGRRVAVVSILPVTDLDKVTPPDGDLERADYLVYTVTSAKESK